MKKKFSFFLTIVLLLNSMNVVSSSLFDNFRLFQVSVSDMVSQLINPDLAKKLIPVAIMASFAVFIYYVKKKIDESFENDREKEGTREGWKPFGNSEEINISYHVIPQWLKVLHQSVSNGGPASCGYHALLRAMQLVFLKKSNINEEEIKSTLMSRENIDDLFGNIDGLWRKFVINHRIIVACKLRLDKELKEIIKFDGLSIESRSKYEFALGFLEATIMSIVRNSRLSEELKDSYEFNEDAIIKYISSSLDDLRTLENEWLIDQLQNPEIIKNVFNTKTLEEVFAQEVLTHEKDSPEGGVQKEKTLMLNKLYDDVINDPNLQEDFKGDWLWDHEIEKLWKDHNLFDLENDPRCCFKVVHNFDLIGQEGFDETTNYVSEKIKPLLQDNQELFSVFILSTARQEGDSNKERGHWYSLVMHKKADKSHEYFLMDSMNKDRTKSSDVCKLINLIELKQKKKVFN